MSYMTKMEGKFSDIAHLINSEIRKKQPGLHMDACSLYINEFATQETKPRASLKLNEIIG